MPSTMVQGTAATVAELQLLIKAWYHFLDYTTGVYIGVVGRDLKAASHGCVNTARLREYVPGDGNARELSCSTS
jgi:hypothetical protein